MKNIGKLFIILLAIASYIYSQEIKFEPKIVILDSVKWSSPENGIQTSLLYGDPAKAGYYIMLYKISKGIKLFPHYHSENRSVMIVSGKFFYSYGSGFDENKMNELTSGTFFTEPSHQPHFAWTKNEEVVLQVNGFGPTGTTFINASGVNKK
jgi:quercetin dioxygenase-like cupin family protein